MFDPLQRAIHQLAQRHNINPPNLSDFPDVAPGDFDAMYAAVALVLEDFPQNLHEQLYETASAVVRCEKRYLFPDSIFDAASGCSSTAEHDDEGILRGLRQAVSDDAAQGGGNTVGIELAEKSVSVLDGLDIDTERQFALPWERSLAQRLTYSSPTTHVAQRDECTGRAAGGVGVQVWETVMETAGDKSTINTDFRADENSQNGITDWLYHLPSAEGVAVNGKSALSADAVGTMINLIEQSILSDDRRASAEFEAEESILRWQNSPRTQTEVTNEGIQTSPCVFATEASTFGKQTSGKGRKTKVGSKTGAERSSHERVILPPGCRFDVVNSNERHPISDAVDQLTVSDTRASADDLKDCIELDEDERTACSEKKGQADWVRQICEEIGYRRAEGNEKIMPFAGVFMNGWRRFGSSYFATPDGLSPEDNADTVAMREMGVPSREELVAAFGGRTTWTKRERKVLQEAVNDRIDEDSREETEERELIERWNKDIWKNVLVEGRGGKIRKRDADDSMCVYLNSEASWVGKVKWKGHEDARLEEGVKSCLKQANSGGWVGVAKTVGGRGALECLRRWRELEEDEERKRSRGWSKEDDARLGELTRKLGEGNWASIALMLGGRSGQQCLFRWRKVGAERRIGKWDEEELERLRKAVREVGTDWVAVSRQVGGRSDVQCREKWMNCEQPGVAKGGWSVEEDEKLTKMVEIWGAGKWSKVASGVKGRTGAQCKKRWSRLRRKDERTKTQKVEERSMSNKEDGRRDVTKQ